MSGGEARALPRAEYATCGQTTYDQAILDQVVEAGVVAGHPRPLPRICPYEPVDLFARPAVGAAIEPAPAEKPAAKKGLIKRIRDKVKL